jgi:hypothetical protein
MKTNNFADYSTVIIYSQTVDDFSSLSDIVLFCMYKWFTADKLDLNLAKANIITFTVILYYIH